VVGGDDDVEIDDMVGGDDEVDVDDVVGGDDEVDVDNVVGGDDVVWGDDEVDVDDAGDETEDEAGEETSGDEVELFSGVVDGAAEQGVVGEAVTQAQRALAEACTAIAPRPQLARTQLIASDWIDEELEH
jgi:hypothetical protein